MYNINIKSASKLKGDKMSFEINGPTPAKGIQEAQSMRNNGGGGNLGYFRRENQKKKKKEEIDVFTPSMDEDEFLSEEADKNTENSFLDRIAEKQMKMWR